MKKLKVRKILSVFLIILCLLIAFPLSACDKNTSETEDSAVQDYPVEGTWVATVSWSESNSYPFNGTTTTIVTYYKTVAYMQFLPGGAMKNRVIGHINSKPVSDTGWVIAPITWSVSGNVIQLSNGRQYVIVNDEFDDLFDNHVYRYTKQQGTTE